MSNQSEKQWQEKEGVKGMKVTKEQDKQLNKVQQIAALLDDLQDQALKGLEYPNEQLLQPAPEPYLKSARALIARATEDVPVEFHGDFFDFALDTDATTIETCIALNAATMPTGLWLWSEYELMQQM